MKMCRNFCHHRHSPAFLLGNRHLADDLRIHIQSLAGTGSPGQSIFVQVLCGKIVVIGPIRIGRLFIKLTIVIDIFIIPSSSKRCPPPVRLVFWAGQSHYRTDVTRHTCLSIRLVTVSSALWQYSQFPLPFENVHNFLGFLRIFKISLVVWQYSLFRFHFNQICWFVVICDIDAFCKDQVSNTEPGFLRGVVQSLSSWPPPPPKDIWPLDKIVVSTKYLMQAKMRRCICREPLIVRNVLFIIGRKSMANTWLCWVGSVQEELLLDSTSLAMWLDTYICKCSW